MSMDKNFQPSFFEKKLYSFWEDNNYFKAKFDSKKNPFCIVLPPPNANANLHMGHAMYVYEDIMIRYHKLLGDEVLWLPGADHAGIETQFVYEKHLKQEGKSRFDFDRKTLFSDIWAFVMKNRGIMEEQLRSLGFALDWSKKKFTMDEDVVDIVYNTFSSLHEKDLIYRDKKLVNYCTECGTSFSDFEVVYKERVDPLCYIKYGPFVVATVRPETICGDTGVAIHPKDSRYIHLIGQTLEIDGPWGIINVKVIADDAVDTTFGTGILKITPAHDYTDYEIGKRHNLPLKQIIDFDGKINTGPYKGLYVNQARKKAIEDIENAGLMVKKEEKYNHRVGACYRCSRVIEPLPKEQWFINVKPLTTNAIELVKTGRIKVHPIRFKKQLISMLENFIDWNISRQIVWGIRVPAFYDKANDKWFVEPDKSKHEELLKNENIIQDEDTFDTWFSSGQWPFITVQTQEDKQLHNYFYPTTVMETGYDILRPWVARMIMMGSLVTGKEPFQHVYLHGMVRDKNGQKMSKSKGNVINPLEIVATHGADALRTALLFGTKEGGDTVLSQEKVIGMRNFINKLWNIARFINLNMQNEDKSTGNSNESIEKLKEEIKEVKKNYNLFMKNFQFSRALELLYEFIWHRFADYYIEILKKDIQDGNKKVLNELQDLFLSCLVMLHPFAPFITEAIWQIFHGETKSILDSGYLEKKVKKNNL